MAAIQLRVLTEAIAFDHRRSRIMANVTVLYARPEEKAVTEIKEELG